MITEMKPPPPPPSMLLPPPDQHRNNKFPDQPSPSSRSALLGERPIGNYVAFIN